MQGLQPLARSQAPPLSRRIHPDVDPVAGLTFAESDLLQGDSLDQTVTWNGNGDLSVVGEMLAIRIRMFQAKIFAYRV